MNGWASDFMWDRRWLTIKTIQTLELFKGIGAPRCALKGQGVPVKTIDYVKIDEKGCKVIQCHV